MVEVAVPRGGVQSSEYASVWKSEYDFRRAYVRGDYGDDLHDSAEYSVFDAGEFLEWVGQVAEG